MHLSPVTHLEDEPLIVSTQRWSIALLTVFVLWVLVLFDPHIWLARYAGEILRQIPKFTYLALALMIVLLAPGRVWYLPLLVFVVGGIMASPFAENIGYAQDHIVKFLLLYYFLAIGTLTFINSVDKTTRVLHLFLWQFLWWSLHAGVWGNGVWWHPDLRDEDGFGPLMVMGIGYCFYFGMATQNRRLRLVAFFLSGLSLIGVVGSFARGAVLAAGAILAYGWIRSPRKGPTLAAVVLGLGTVAIAANVLFPGGAFWEEMSSISEGFDTGTGLDRWVLWKTAWREFLENPIFGVGAGNFGVFAGAHLWSDPELIARYHSPGRLWGRQVHSLYFQVLSEFGLVGTIAFVVLLIDFWRRNAELRSVPLVAGWWSATQHRFDLHMLSLALEAATVGFLVSGIFYNQLYIHWFYSILTLNALLHLNAKRLVLHQHPLSSQ